MLDEESYRSTTAKLQAATSNRLRVAAGDVERLRDVILSYLKEGYGLDFSSSELIDLFCVSTPNIVEAAGLSITEGDAVVTLFDGLHERFRQEKGIA